MQESLQKLNLAYVDLYLMHYPIGEQNGGSIRKFNGAEVR
jgi:diketogulonate reductase-like aldo/keto reductase